MTQEIGFEPILYLLARWDIPDMNPGKLGAQCAHAADEFHDLATAEIILWPEDHFARVWSKWCGDRKFGTTIVLKATNAEIEDLVYAGSYKFSDYVHDPTYPIRNWQGEIFTVPMNTVGWIFPTSPEGVDAIKNSGLELYP